MSNHHKTLNRNQVILLRRVLAIYEARSEEHYGLPGRSNAYYTAGDLLRAVLDNEEDVAKTCISAYEARTNMTRPEPMEIDTTIECEMVVSDPPELEAYRQLLLTIKSNGIDEGDRFHD